MSRKFEPVQDIISPYAKSKLNNDLKYLFENVKTQGKTIQDLVAEGQLTPEQYATLIKSINSMAVKSEVRENTNARPINVSEMDTETKELFTGGAVAVVGEDAVGRENIKTSAVSPPETNFLELDKTLTLYDGNFLRKTVNGGAGSFYLGDNSLGRVAKIAVKPNTTYSVIRQPSDRFKIGTDTIISRQSGNFDGEVSLNLLGSSDTYHSTFNTGENDVVLYVDYTFTDENVLIQIVEGEQSEMTITNYPFKPSNNLPIYTKKEVDEKEFSGDAMTFLERVNLFDGNFIRKSITGSPAGSQYLAEAALNRTAKIQVQPNKTYSVIRGRSDRFKIASDVVPNRVEGTLEGSVNITITGSSDTMNSTFTTGSDDVVVYINYTLSDEDVYVEVVEGVESKATINSYNLYNPSDELNVYSKDEVDRFLRNTDITVPSTLKILTIGNSFSVDATTFLYDIAKSAGVDIVVGNAYDSGQSLKGHWEKIQNNEGITSYEKWTPGKGNTGIPDALVSDILSDENWDIITFQQASSSSFRYDTFQPYLTDLYNYAKGINPDARFGLHMTWAYAAPTNHETSVEMYKAIVDAYKMAMEEMDFDILLPTGTAIENARTNTQLEAVGDSITMDGAHLERGIGRYIAALTLFEVLVASHYKKDIFADVSYIPDQSDATKYLCYLSKISAKNAALNPFKVTEI